MTASDQRGPLAGLRVLDLTEHMAGPFCTMILADMGAEVLKVERPGKGDSSRAMGDGTERNPFFRYINRNKKSVTLDYKGPTGRAQTLLWRMFDDVERRLLEVVSAGRSENPGACSPSRSVVSKTRT